MNVFLAVRIFHLIAYSSTLFWGQKGGGKLTIAKI